MRPILHAETFIQSETRPSLCSWAFACFPLAQSRVRSAPLIRGVALGPPSSHPTSHRLGHQASTSAPSRSHATTHKFLIINADRSSERAGPLGVDDGLPPGEAGARAECRQRQTEADPAVEPHRRSRSAHIGGLCNCDYSRLQKFCVAGFNGPDRAPPDCASPFFWQVVFVLSTR